MFYKIQFICCNRGKAFARETCIYSGNQLGNGHEIHGFHGIRALFHISDDNQQRINYLLIFIIVFMDRNRHL